MQLVCYLDVCRKQYKFLLRNLRFMKDFCKHDVFTNFHHRCYYIYCCYTAIYIADNLNYSIMRINLSWLELQPDLASQYLSKSSCNILYHTFFSKLGDQPNWTVIYGINWTTSSIYGKIFWLYTELKKPALMKKKVFSKRYCIASLKTSTAIVWAAIRLNRFLVIMYFQINLFHVDYCFHKTA